MVIVVTLKVSEDEKNAWKKAAESQGRSLNGWVRDLLNAAEKKQRKKAKKAN